MKLGLVGVGRIGAFHAETLSRIEAVETLVIADAQPGRASAVAAELKGKLNIEVAEGTEALLTSGIAGVVIAAATDAHPTTFLWTHSRMRSEPSFLPSPKSSQASKLPVAPLHRCTVAPLHRCTVAPLHRCGRYRV